MAFRHGQEFARHVVPSVVKPARTLWNQFIAFLFFSFAFIFGLRAGRMAVDFSNATAAGEGSLLRLVIAAFCTLLMLWFGITSLLRARKISRS
jgi:hypothetical protein